MIFKNGTEINIPAYFTQFLLVARVRLSRREPAGPPYLVRMFLRKALVLVGLFPFRTKDSDFLPPSTKSFRWLVDVFPCSGHRYKKLSTAM